MQTSYTKKTFAIFWQHLKKYQWLTWSSLVLVFLACAANLYAPFWYKRFFDLLNQGQTGFDSYLAVLINILLVNLAGWFLWRLAFFAISRFQAYTMADLANTCFRYIHRHSVSFFNDNFVGALVKRVNRFVSAFETVTDMVSFELFQIVIKGSGIIIILFFKNWWLGLIMLVWLIIFVGSNYWFSMYKLKYDLERSQVDSKATGFLSDTITNQQNIKLFNGYEREVDEYQRLSFWQRTLRLANWNRGNWFDAWQSFLMIALEFSIFFLLLKLWQRGAATLGDFVLVQAYLLNLLGQLWSLGRIIRRYYESMAEADEMTEILETPNEIQDSRQAKDLVVSKGQIEFKEVGFCYSGTRRIFQKFDLLIKPRQRLAIVGPSGSGKTTLTALLLRNYDLERGKILIDGQKIAQATQESLWQNISLVPQDPILFHRTLLENIRYGRPEATDEEVIEAAKLARAHDFIMNCPEGYGAYVGERGVKLSGGERQRVAIARAILKNAPILVLDEATSSLDSESEELIQAALVNLMKNKTVIVVAHRLSTIMKMDRIIVMQDGRIVEDGSHQELLKNKKGLYFRLWNKQAGGFIE